jgi:YidC/Oxa1 family membrane protein insertase
LNTRKFAIILLVAAATMMAWTFFMKKDEKQDQPSAAADTQPAKAVTSSSAAVVSVPAESADVFILGSLKPGPDKGGTNPYTIQVELTSDDAAIRGVKLRDYFATVADKQLFRKDPAGYEKIAAADPNTYKGHYAVLHPVLFRETQYLSLATSRIKLWVGQRAEPYVYPVAGEKLKWKRIKTDKDPSGCVRSVTFEWSQAHNVNYADPSKPAKWEKAIALQKIYFIEPDSFSIKVSMKLINYTSRKIRLAIHQAGPIGIDQEDTRGDQRMAAYALLEDGKIQPVLKGVKDLDKAPYGQAEEIGRSDGSEKQVLWLGVANKFFGSLLYLTPKTKDTLNAGAYKAQFYITPVQAGPQTDGSSGRAWATGMWINDLTPLTVAEAKSENTLELDLFTGPKLRDLFSKKGSLYARLQYIDTISSGSCGWCTFAWLRDKLMWLLTIFARYLFFGNYGLAIILLVVIVRVVLHPLTKKGQVSMSKMQKQMAALKPKMDKLKEKFGNDKAALSREQMKLYKQHGNPMGQMMGCLPMMLQMPIWVALFSGLNTNVALRHAAFLPVWITDLAAPDQLFTWHSDLPLIGHAFNLLPILLTVAMFLQTKFNPQMNQAAGSPEQAQQQKMMKYMMPLMMLFFFYKAPSGLTMYIMASTTIGVIEQYFIRKHIKEREELEAAAETVVKVSGKGSRESRPKKPKGPFFTKRG